MEEEQRKSTWPPFVVSHVQTPLCVRSHGDALPVATESKRDTRGVRVPLRA